MPSEMCKKLALTKEHRRVVGMSCVALLDAEKAAINWFADILGGNMTLGEETQTETDTFGREVLCRCGSSMTPPPPRLSACGFKGLPSLFRSRSTAFHSSS